MKRHLSSMLAAALLAVGVSSAEPPRQRPAKGPTTLEVRTVTRTSRGVELPRARAGFKLFWAEEPGAPFHVGRTGADGRALVRLDAAKLDLFRSGRSNVRGFMAEPGLMGLFASTELRQARGGQRLELVLEARAGATREVQLRGLRAELVQGRLVVSACEPNARRVLRTSEPLEAQPIGRGRFLIHFERDVDCLAYAVADELGTGGKRRLELRLDDPGLPAIVQVATAGSLRGRIVDAAGRPQGGLHLLATHVDLAAEHGERWMDHQEEFETRLEGGGFVQRFAKTRADGTFRIQGVREGEYVVRARVPGGERGAFDLPVARLGASSDRASSDRASRSVALTDHVVEHELLVVHVASPQARSDSSAPRTGAHRTASPGWPKEPEVSVLDAGPIGATPRPGARIHALTGPALRTTRSSEGGVNCFRVRSGRQYWVLARGPLYDGSPRLVEVPAGAMRHAVELPAGSPLGLGELEVERALLEDAEPAQAFRVRLLEPSTRIELARASTIEQRLTLQAPPGNYVAVVERGPGLDEAGELPRRTLGRVELAVTLRPMEKTEHWVDLRRAERERLPLHGALDPNSNRGPMRDGGEAVDSQPDRARAARGVSDPTE